MEGLYGKVVCQVFLPCVVGNNHWRKNCTVSLMKDFCTVSDEVFCLFMLENSYDMWVDGWKFKEEVKGGKKESKRRPKDERVGPLYTVGSGSEARKYKGWSKKGMERWNELYGVIKGKRGDDEFDVSFRNGMVRKRISGDSTGSSDNCGESLSVETVELMDDLDEYKYTEQV